MGEQTGIQWTDKTWNPWMGCRKRSPGCDNCYMFREQVHYGNDPTVVRKAKTTFYAPLKWDKPARVFTCSWSDWFIREADAWRGEAWDIIRRTPHLTYQILTKRTERIAQCLPPDWGNGYPNVQLIASVENQEYADRRIPELLRIPSAVRGLSMEPLLGPVDLMYPTALYPNGPKYCCSGDMCGCRGLPVDPPLIHGIDWVIIGGESGPGARLMQLQWVRDIIAQCRAAGVAVFVKQLGSVWAKANKAKHPKGGDWDEWPADVRVREWPKGA